MYMYYRQMQGGQIPGQTFGFPGGGFPGIPGFPGTGSLERRIERLERQVERLDRRVNQIDRRLDRVERRLGLTREDTYY